MKLNIDNRYKDRLINVLVGKTIVLKLLEGKPINVVLFEEEKNNKLK